jgi:uncharacterized lipoprotein YehR (DUF1307 family)
MFKKIFVLVAASILVVGINGCDSQKGTAFEGHWEGGTQKAPVTLDIKYSKGVYHVDHSYKTIFMDKPTNVKLEATAMSDEVLKVSEGFGGLNMRLENGHLYFDNQKYNKPK